MFWATNSPSSGALFDCIYSFCYNAPPLLPTGATVEMEHFHLNRGTGQQQRWCIVPKAVCSQKVLLRMGEYVARNMLGWFKKINKWKICRILLVVYILEPPVYVYLYCLPLSNVYYTDANMNINSLPWIQTYKNEYHQPFLNISALSSYIVLHTTSLTFHCETCTSSSILLLPLYHSLQYFQHFGHV